MDVRSPRPHGRIGQKLMVVGGLTATIALVASCSSPAASTAQHDATGPITLQTWGDVKSIQTMFASYQAANKSTTQGTSLNVLSGGANDTDSIAKFRLELSAGKDIPDIMELNYSELAEFADSGVLGDLTGEIGPYLGNVTKAAQALTKYNRKSIAVPIQVNEKLWFYRSDLFAKAGIDPTKITTQADFITAGKQLQKVAPASYVWNIGPNPQQYQWGMIVSGNGASYSTKSPTCAITVGTDKGVAEAFHAMKDLRSSGVVASRIDDSTPQWQSGLADGTIASTLGASWLPTFLEQYAPDLKGKWAVANWPQIGGAIGGSEAGGAIFVITNASRHKTAAANFLTKTLMTASGASAYMKDNPSYIPNVTSLLEDPAVQNNPYFGQSLIKTYLDASNSYKIFPYDPAANKETTVLSAQLANYLSSSADSPASYLKTAQDQLTAQVGCPFTN